MGKIRSFEELNVYQKLCDLHLQINRLTFTFPKFELYELGAQLRRSSNSIPANIAECFSNKHINIYLEGLNRALGELRETKHHLYIAFKKKYLSKKVYEDHINGYDECGKMLRGLEKSLIKHRSKKTTNN